MYICLEGMDGSGKSTQIILLKKWFEDCGFDVIQVFEPTDSSVGELIREMLKSPNATDKKFQQTLALLFAADRMMLMEKIKDAELLDKIVISDRCFYSSLVYQEEEEWVYQINKFVKEPDIVILLDLEPEKALRRCDGKDHFENCTFLANIREKYLKLSEDKDFFVVNANNGINKVHDDIKKIIAPKLGMCI